MKTPSVGALSGGGVSITQSVKETKALEAKPESQPIDPISDIKDQITNLSQKIDSGDNDQVINKLSGIIDQISKLHFSMSTEFGYIGTKPSIDSANIESIKTEIDKLTVIISSLQKPKEWIFDATKGDNGNYKIKATQIVR